MRRLTLVLPLLVAACTDDPLRRIPPTDRALLEAEARLGSTGQPGGRTSIEEMLARARGEGAPAGTAAAPRDGALVLRFDGQAVQPEPPQLAQLYAFAARAGGGRLVVTGGRGDPAMLGERRAIAVARALEALGPPVELRFASGAPPDAVQIASGGGTPLAPAGGR